MSGSRCGGKGENLSGMGTLTSGRTRLWIPPAAALAGAVLLAARRGWIRSLLLRTLHVEAAVTVEAPREEVYAYWQSRREDLPRLLLHPPAVAAQPGEAARPDLSPPAGETVHLVRDAAPSLLAWVAGRRNGVWSHGTLRFRSVEGRGTEVIASVDYRLPAVGLWGPVAKVIGRDPEQRVTEALRRFKHLVEAGEVPTTRGQPTGRRRV